MEKLDQLEKAIQSLSSSNIDKTHENAEKVEEPTANLKETKENKFSRLQSVTKRVLNNEDHHIKDPFGDVMKSGMAGLNDKAALGDKNVQSLDEDENTFWRDLIEVYLKPLKKDEDQEKKVSAGLLQLRNMVAFSFLMINSIWVLTIFMLQSYKNIIYIPWPVDGSEGKLTLDPVAFVFMVFFLVVLLIQMVGMLAHRLMTLGHFVSTTKIGIRENNFNGDQEIRKHAVNLFRSMIKNLPVSIHNSYFSIVKYQRAVIITIFIV